jgi:hypothetical protein
MGFDRICTAIMLRAIPIVVALLAQEPARTVTLPSDWAVGMRYHIELTKTREKYERGDLKERALNLTPIDVEVLEKRDDGYTVRWTLGSSAILGREDVDAMSERIAELNRGLQVDFKTDRQGSFVSLAAPEKIEAEMSKRIDVLGKELLKQGMSADEVAAFTRILSQSYRGESYRALLAKEPQLFYMPSGSSLSVGQKRAWESSLPNPLGGEPLPANAYLELRTLRPEKNEAVVEWRQSIDAVKAGPILEASVREAAKQRGKELPEGVTVNMDALEDAATYVYDSKTGVPRSVEWSRSSVMVGAREINGARFDVTVPAPK